MDFGFPQKPYGSVFSGLLGQVIQWAGLVLDYTQFIFLNGN